MFGSRTMGRLRAERMSSSGMVPTNGENESAFPDTAKFRPVERGLRGSNAARISSRFQFTRCAKLWASGQVEVRPSLRRWSDWLFHRGIQLRKRADEKNTATTKPASRSKTLRSTLQRSV